MKIGLGAILDRIYLRGGCPGRFGPLRSGLRGVNKLAAGLGHGRSLGVRALLENQIGRNLGSDLSKGWVSVLLLYGVWENFLI